MANVGSVTLVLENTTNRGKSREKKEKLKLSQKKLPSNWMMTRGREVLIFVVIFTGHSNNTCHTWHFLDYFRPLPPCVFWSHWHGPLWPPTPFPRDVTSFSKVQAFSRLWTAKQNWKLLFKKDQKVLLDSLVYTLPPPCVIWWH